MTIPYTDDLEDTFKAAYGHSLLAHLPELFWEIGADEVSVIRYEYHDHIAERFADAFADTVGNWCSTHNIALTGHMMEEPTLDSQTAELGVTVRVPHLTWTSMAGEAKRDYPAAIGYQSPW